MSLDVYKASAGSGKTFALTQQYINLLSKTSHQEILAVTFTNKATDEMKERIVSVLAKIADGVAKKEENEAGLSKEEGRTMLSKLLHDYGRFNVSTIDGFYQQVMRSFVRELGLYAGYTLVLNQQEVIEKALDELILSLESEENQHLYQWLLRRAENRIKQEKDWSFRKVLTELAHQLFQEDVVASIRLLQKETNCIELIAAYQQQLDDIIKGICSRIKTAVTAIVQVFESAGLQLKEDTSRGILQQLKTKISSNEWPDFSDTFLNLRQDWEAAFKADFKKKNAATLELLQRKGFPTLLEKLFALMEQEKTLFFSAKAVFDQLDLLPVLLDLGTCIQRYLRDNNMVLLSQVNTFLREVISDCDAPFIYEKVGTRLHHFMLDEFQDTSIMQWENFKPLIAESLSNRKDNLIVGDVKQSIYRWRNSDWRILSTLLAQTFPVKNNTLDTNWRSQRYIVEFNNAFFIALADSLAGKIAPAYGEMLQKMYADVAQKVADKKALTTGYVHVEMLHRKMDAEELQQLQQKRLIETILQVLEQGYCYRDIAVLINKQDEGNLVAQWLLQAKIPIISVDSLQLSQSPAVRMLLAIIRLSCSLQPDVDAYKLKMLCALSDKDLDDITKAMQKPLFEAVEQYIRLLRLHEDAKNSVYLQAFQDTVADFVAQHYADAKTFIEWWDTVGYETKLPDNDQQNAVQVMTIHKSKGLAFPVVIMPFSNQSVWREGKIMWCRTEGTPINGLPVVPVAWKKSLGNSFFNEAYEEEYAYQVVDFINKWYVAFTRAENAMYVFSFDASSSKENGESKAAPKGYILLKQLMEGVSATLSNNKLPATLHTEDDMQLFTIGSLPEKVSEEEKEKEAASKAEKNDEEVAIIAELPYSSHPYQDNNLRLRLQADFSQQQRDGNTLHHILQYMQTSADAEKAIDKVIRQGMMMEQQREWARQEIAKVLQHPQVKTWFDGSYPTVWNERTIIAQQADNHSALYRPDRLLVKDNSIVVVDYKFGEVKKSYNRQIARYMRMLQEMNKWQEVKGYLYYHKTGEVVSVSI